MNSPGDFLVVVDPQMPSTWHLQVRSNGKPDHRLMGEAWAALHSGFRGNQYQGPDKQTAIDKLKAMYEAEKMPMPVMESEDAAGESVSVIEAAGVPLAAPQGSKWRVRVFEYGFSKNTYKDKSGEPRPLFWTQESARAMLPHIDGARCFADHAEQPSVRNLIGFYSEASIGPKGPEATLSVMESEDWAQRKMLAAWKLGQPLAFSVRAALGVKPVLQGNRKAFQVDEVAALQSCDLVSAASSGGASLAVLEQQQVPAPSGADIPSSATRSHQGAHMLEKLKKVLQALRAVHNVSQTFVTEAAAIETESAKTDADHSELLIRATEALSKASVESAKNGEDVTEVSEQITALQEQVADAKQKQLVAESRQTLLLKITESKLPSKLTKKIKQTFEKAFSKGQAVTADEIDMEIKETREAYADFAQGNGARVSNVAATPATVGLETRDKLRIAMKKLFGCTHDYKLVHEGQLTRYMKSGELDSSVPAFQGIQEGYIMFTGDRDIRGMVDEKLLRASEGDMTTADFPNALGEALNLRLLGGYNELDFGLGVLMPEGNRVAVANFLTQERDRIGFFDNIDQVDPESAEYQEIAHPTDEKASYSINTRGNLLSITRRMIKNDRIGAIAQMVSRLGRAVRRTMAQNVFDLMISNAAIYDSVTWAHASSHGANLRTVALSATVATAIAELETISALMFAQTEKDSGAIIGIEPSIAVVPRALAGNIKNANQYEPVEAAGNPVWHKFGANNERIIVSPLLTDVTDFYLLADQTEVPCMEMGFMDGRQDPEFFLADQPTNGRVFTQDVITYKVRHEYETVVIDYRGFAKNVVAG